MEEKCPFCLSQVCEGYRYDEYYKIYSCGTAYSPLRSRFLRSGRCYESEIAKLKKIISQAKEG